MTSAPNVGNISVQLIQLYTAEPVLWDKRCEAADPNKRRKNRVRALKRIAGAMANYRRMTVKDVSLRIKKIRKLYKKENIRRRRQQRLFRAAEGDAATPPPYVSKYSWFPVFDAFMSNGRPERQTAPSPKPDAPLPLPEVEQLHDVQPQDHTAVEEVAHCSYAYSNDNVSTEPSFTDIDPAKPTYSLEDFFYTQPVQTTLERFLNYLEGSLEALAPNVALMALKEINDTVINHKIMEFN